MFKAHLHLSSLSFALFFLYWVITLFQFLIALHKSKLLVLILCLWHVAKFPSLSEYLDFAYDVFGHANVSMSLLIALHFASCIGTLSPFLSACTISFSLFSIYSEFGIYSCILHEEQI